MTTNLILIAKAMITDLIDSALLVGTLQLHTILSQCNIISGFFYISLLVI